MKAFIVAVVVVLVAGASARRLERDDLWTAYKATHTKVYRGQEEIVRRAIWESNLNYIQRHNVEADRGEHSYWMGENHYTDMTNDEFRSLMNGYIMSNKTTHVQYIPNTRDTPDSVDWRQKGYVTDVKDQRQCGSCWAFSTTGSLEGQNFKKSGKLVSLSEQNLIDCSKKYGNKGCKGGLMDNAFKYIINNKGIDTESSYPYKGRDGLCEFKSSDVGATETSFVDVKRGSEEALEQAVAEIGPISVAMDAGHPSFQHYRSGIYTEPRCSSIRLDHGVLAVGYGTDGGEQYWLVKNSWGTTWGDQGYFKIAKNKKNMCGLATSASYPVV